MLQHARTALVVDPETVTRPGAATSVLYWASGFGHQAVVIFFVLSGALVGGSVLRSVSNGTWSWSDYLIRRLSRLYIVLIAAMLAIVSVVVVYSYAGSRVTEARTDDLRRAWSGRLRNTSRPL